MFWKNIIHTILNVMVFAFIGFLIWLYLEREPGGDDQEDKKESAPGVKNP